MDQGNGAFIPPLQIFNSRWEQRVFIKSLTKILDCDFKLTYFESEKKNSAFEYEVYTQNENRLALLPSLIECKGMYELRHKALLGIGYNSPHFAVNVQQLAGHIFENTFRVCSIGLLNSILENDSLSEDLDKPEILLTARAVNWLSLNDSESAITDKNKPFSKTDESKSINIAKIAEKLFIGFFNAKIRAECLGQALAVHTDIGCNHIPEKADIKTVLLANILAAKLALVDKVHFYQPVTRELYNEVLAHYDNFIASDTSVKILKVSIHWQKCWKKILISQIKYLDVIELISTKC